MIRKDEGCVSISLWLERTRGVNAYTYSIVRKDEGCVCLHLWLERTRGVFS